MTKLKGRQILSLSLMLFAIFFGAGNMIFPPAMGQQAGENFISGLLGFLLTDVGIALLGMISIVFVGSSMDDLGKLVNKKFAVCLSVFIYLLIGPLFAEPRTGSVSFELAVAPYIPESNMWIGSLIFTGIFFLLTYYLSSNPKKIVDVVGNVLTPILLLSITAIFLKVLFTTSDANSAVVYGNFAEAQGVYKTMPFFQGMIEGYNSLDGPAGLAFAIIVIKSLKDYGITDKKGITKYTILSGIGSICFLAIVYFMLAYIGAITETSFANGGALLYGIATETYGGVGGIILGIAVTLACLTTSIGLTTSFSDYFVKLFPKFTYKQIAAVVCIFSFVISNVGLTTLVSISLPILKIIYPVTVALIILSFFKDIIKERKMVYILSLTLAFIVSFVNSLNMLSFMQPIDTLFKSILPFYETGFGWFLPALIGALLGLLPFMNVRFKKQQETV